MCCIVICTLTSIWYDLYQDEISLPSHRPRIDYLLNINNAKLLTYCLEIADWLVDVSHLTRCLAFNRWAVEWLDYANKMFLFQVLDWTFFSCQHGWPRPPRSSASTLLILTLCVNITLCNFDSGCLSCLVEWLCLTLLSTGHSSSSSSCASLWV